MQVHKIFLQLKLIRGGMLLLGEEACGSLERKLLAKADIFPKSCKPKCRRLCDGRHIHTSYIHTYIHTSSVRKPILVSVGRQGSDKSARQLTADEVHGAQHRGVVPV